MTLALASARTSVPDTGSDLLLWNLSPDPMPILAWPDAPPCHEIGDVENGFDVLDGDPVPIMNVAPGERITMHIEGNILQPITVGEENFNVFSVTTGSVAMAAQFPRLTDGALAEMRELNEQWGIPSSEFVEPERHSSFVLLGRNDTWNFCNE